MKKILVLAAFVSILFTSNTVDAQHTTPRFGTATNQDRTYRPMTLGLKYVADTAGATVDTLFLSPNNFTDNVVVTLTDSCVIAFKSLAGSWLGDNMTVTIEATSGAGKFVNFLGTVAIPTKWGMSSTGTKISLASGKSATLRFYFDGVLWNEVSRSIR